MDRPFTLAFIMDRSFTLASLWTVPLLEHDNGQVLYSCIIMDMSFTLALMLDRSFTLTLIMVAKCLH